MIKTCKICTNTFEYCTNCAIKHIHYKQKGMCSNDCYEISNIKELIVNRKLKSLLIKIEIDLRYFVVAKKSKMWCMGLVHFGPFHFY